MLNNDVKDQYLLDVLFGLKLHAVDDPHMGLYDPIQYLHQVPVAYVLRKLTLTHVEIVTKNTLIACVMNCMKVACGPDQLIRTLMFREDGVRALLKSYPNLMTLMRM